VTREIRSGKKRANVCQEFSVVNSAIKMIWKNRTVSVFEQNGSQMKQLQKPKRSDTDKIPVQATK
jgi:hypothetical protein